jgi:hypothetical protein
LVGTIVVVRRVMGVLLVAILIGAAPAFAQSGPAPDPAPSGPSPDPVPAAARAATPSSTPAPVAVTRPVTPSAPAVTPTARPVTPSPAPTPQPVVPTRTVTVRPAIPSTAPVRPTARRTRSEPAKRPVAKPKRSHLRPHRATTSALPILAPPSYATPRPILRVKRVIASVRRTGADRALLGAAAGALALLALSSASLLVLTRRLKREVRAA